MYSVRTTNIRVVIVNYRTKMSAVAVVATVVCAPDN